MASVNKVILVGNLGRDPEMRSFPNGDQIANVTVATTDKWKDKQTGDMREHTEWHRLVFTGRLAEIAGQYLRKGSQIYVEGSIRTRKWTDQQSGQDRYATEVRVDQMQMLGKREGMGASGGDGDGYGNQGSYGNQGGGGYAPRQPAAAAPAAARPVAPSVPAPYGKHSCVSTQPPPSATGTLGAAPHRPRWSAAPTAVAASLRGAYHSPHL